MPELMSSPDLRAALLDAGVLIDGGVDGLYHRSGAFESVIRGLDSLASAAGADQGAPEYFFPPVMPRRAFLGTDYLRSFPDLIGSVHTFVGNDRDHAALLRLLEDGEDWTQALQPSEVVLCSAICHSLYPRLQHTSVPDAAVYECHGHAFRHEPSLDPARMQSFRMHEFVFVGTPDGAIAHRDEWLRRGLDLLGGLGLQVSSEVANDPFFGRAGRMLAANQRQTELKYEIVAPITSDRLTAISSANCHEDHFGHNFEITLADGSPAHTSCFGFGLERIALALYSRHGLALAQWPDEVRSRLRLDPRREPVAPPR